MTVCPTDPDANTPPRPIAVLVIDDQAIAAVGVPVDAAQIHIQTALRQGLGQQREQALAVDGFTGGAHRALLGQPDQKATVDQGDASATALFARTALLAEAGMEVAFHGNKTRKRKTH